MTKRFKEMSKDIDKHNDISKLIEMLGFINRFELNEATLEKTLIDIGNLSGGTDRISYNDKNDKNGDYIRNKYGYFKRHIDINQINNEGIYFEKLYHLKIVLEKLNTNYFNNEFKNQASSLMQELFLLKKKIQYIFNQEKVFIEKDEILKKQISFDDSTENPDIKSIITFSEIHYTQVILEEIQKELENSEAIYFNIREDRYYFARIFTIIGELSNEYNKTIDNNADLSNLLKTLSGIRSILIHDNEKIWLGCGNTSKTANTYIKSLKEGLLEVIIQDEKTKQLKLDTNSEKIKELHKISENLKKLLYPGDVSKKTVKESVVINKPIKTDEATSKLKTKLNNFIDNANKMIIKSKNLEDPKFLRNLENIDDKYQKLLQEHPDKNNSYPKSLNLSAKEQIALLSLELKNPIDKNESKLTKEERVKEKQQKVTKKENNIVELLKCLNEQLKYLEEVEKSDKISSAKKPRIIEQIITTIGQYFKDIENNDTKNSILNTSSLISEKASVSSKDSRSKGLAHDIFSLDKKELMNKIKNDIQPASMHFKLILNIQEQKNSTFDLSILTRNNMGVYYLKLGFYKQAIDYFKENVEYIKNNPNSTSEIKLQSMGITQENVNVNVIDIDEHLSGVDSYNLIAQKNLIAAYLLSSDYKSAYEILETLMKKINLLNLKFFSLMNVSEIINSAACCLDFQGKYQDANKLLKQAVSILYNPNIKLNLASSYVKLKQYDDAINLYESLLKDQDPFLKFSTIEHYLGLLSYMDKKSIISKADTYIIEMNEILKNNSAAFKQEFGDKYFLMLLSPIRLQILVIIEKFIVDKSRSIELYLELEKLEKTCNTITNIVKQDLQKDIKISDIYLTFSQAFSSLIISNNAIKQKDIQNKDLQKLKKAQGYFDKGVELGNSEQEKLVKTAENLAIAYSNYGENYAVNSNLCIEFLKKALIIQEKYNIENSVTLSNLGSEYCSLGNTAFDNQKFDEAIKDFDKAISYFSLVDNSKLSFEGFEALAMSYEYLGYLKYDLETLQKAMDSYDKAIKLSPDDRNITTYQQDNKDKISTVKNLFTVLKNKLSSIGQMSENENIGIEIVSTSNVEFYALSLYKQNSMIQGLTKVDKGYLIKLNDTQSLVKFKYYLDQQLNSSDEQKSICKNNNNQEKIVEQFLNSTKESSDNDSSLSGDISENSTDE
jgi:tetratricopeptide (TPR) repeat protein